MKKGLDKVKLVKGRARAVIGQPRSTQVLPNKKKNRSEKRLRRERELTDEDFEVVHG
jgi:hypothetical protein